MLGDSPSIVKEITPCPDAAGTLCDGKTNLPLNAAI
jgi:hypothetical protein